VISVVINCHNGLEYVPAAITSVLAQTDRNWELVFWDNASTEPVLDLVHKYGDSRIRCFRSEDFTPLGTARNRALEQVRGDYIAFLDADDYWMPEKLAKQRQIFEADAEAGLVYTDAHIVYDGKVTKSVSRGTPPEGMVFERLLAAYFLVMSSVMIRRTALQSLTHWFDPRLEVTADYDLFVRIGSVWRVRCANEVLSAWRWHSAGTQMTKRRLIGLEKRLILKKLRKEYPSLMGRHQPAVERVRAKILITMALSHYYAGHSRRARRMLRKSNKANLKGTLVYGATFFPSALIDVAYRKLKGNPLV